METRALATLRAAARDPAAAARAFKAEGRKVLGVRCLYVPEEVVWAAGMLPYPLYGTPEPVGAADAYFQSCTCEYVRNLFDQALAGRLALLDGIALANTCDVIRRLYDQWNAYVPGSPAYLVNNPQKLLHEGNREFFLEELRRFVAWVERLSGNKVTDEGLRQATALYEEGRGLLRRIWALRQSDAPPLSGPEALEVALGAATLPRPAANRLLGQLLEELGARRVEPRDGPRLLVTGSLLDHPRLVEMVEEEGGQVVCEDLCTSTRLFWHEVQPDPDPLVALWRSLNQRPLCACIHPTSARLEHLLGLARTFRVDGVVYFNLKYCHPFLYEAPLFKQKLEEAGLPTAALDVGHDFSGHGQLRTRLQAFIEMLTL